MQLAIQINYQNTSPHWYFLWLQKPHWMFCWFQNLMAKMVGHLREPKELKQEMPAAVKWNSNHHMSGCESNLSFQLSFKEEHCLFPEHWELCECVNWLHRHSEIWGPGFKDWVEIISCGKAWISSVISVQIFRSQGIVRPVPWFFFRLRN